ncbi:MAG: metallophosphoesterase family protein [candidate division Zixibacteria bacterium]|nr:metallophosphoesterase family protein [candidate division Zixibacteria bacterium]
MANTDTIAVLSDIHGNLLALEAVLEDIDRRSIHHFINLGDCVYGPMDPAGTADLLISTRQRTVRGNEDRFVGDANVSDRQSPSLSFTRSQLNERQCAWLASLPLSATIEPDIFFFHGTPERDDQYLLREVTPQGLRDRTPDELADLLEGIDYRLILCGHDHTPGRVNLPDGRFVVNPGSVGLQAFTDDQPHDHIISNGTPHARYAVLKRIGDGWSVEQVKIEYDWESAAESALVNGREDWAHWLKTGKVTV